MKILLVGAFGWLLAAGLGSWGRPAPPAGSDSGAGAPPDRASILGHLFRVPCVHVLHNTFHTTKYGLKRQPALAVSNSRWMLDDIARWWDVERGGAPMPSTIIVRPPVDPQDYRTAPGGHVTLVNMTAEKGAEVFYALAERFPDLGAVESPVDLIEGSIAA